MCCFITLSTDVPYGQLAYRESAGLGTLSRTTRGDPCLGETDPLKSRTCLSQTPRIPDSQFLPGHAAVSPKAFLHLEIRSPDSYQRFGSRQQIETSQHSKRLLGTFRTASPCFPTLGPEHGPVVQFRAQVDYATVRQHATSCHLHKDA